MKYVVKWHVRVLEILGLAINTYFNDCLRFSITYFLTWGAVPPGPLKSPMVSVLPMVSV